MIPPIQPPTTSFATKLNGDEEDLFTNEKSTVSGPDRMDSNFESCTL